MDEDDCAVKLRQRRGDGFSFSGIVSLPTDTWTTVPALYGVQGKSYVANAGGLTASMTLKGATVGVAGKSDYVLQIVALDTSAWPARNPFEPIDVLVQIQFQGATTGVKKSARNFLEVEVYT